MRVGVLTQYYPPEFGAPQARLSELTTHLESRGHHVKILTAMPNYPTGRVFDGYGGLIKREAKQLSEIIRTPIWPTQRTGLVARLASYSSFAVSSAFLGAITLGRLDVLMTESPPLVLGPTGWALSRLTGARWLFNVSDLWPDSAIRMGALSGHRSQHLAYALESFCYRHAWAITGQSKEIIADIRARYPEVTTYHFSNGVDTRRFSPSTRSEKLRSEVYLGRDLVVLYAGLHGIAQGLEQVLEAASGFSRHPGVGFFFLGDGPAKAELQRTAKRRRLQNVTFLPPQPHESMPALVASADVSVVPLKERLTGAVPSKIYEAMASGVAVLLGTEGEAAEIVRGAGAGLVFDAGDASQLSSALNRLLNDVPSRIQMAAAGRHASEKRYDRQEICGRFIDWLEGVVSNDRQRAKG